MVHANEAPNFLPGTRGSWTRFARAFVHEVRSPLNALGIYAELVAQPSPTPDGLAKLSARARSQVLRVDDLLKRMLMLWAAEEAASAPLSEIASATVGFAGHEARRMGAEIVAELAPDLQVRASPTDVTDVLVRSLAGAFSERTAGARLILQAMRADQVVRLSLSATRDGQPVRLWPDEAGELSDGARFVATRDRLTWEWPVSDGT